MERNTRQTRNIRRYKLILYVLLSVLACSARVGAIVCPIENDDRLLSDTKSQHSGMDYSSAPDAPDFAQQGSAIGSTCDISEIESWLRTNTTLFEAPPNPGVGGHAVYKMLDQTG